MDKMVYQYTRFCDKMINNIIAIVCILFAFFGTLFLIKKWIFVAKNINLVGKDMNKYNKPSVAEGGGIVIMIAVVFSIMLYIFFKTFLLGNETNMINIFSVLLTIMLAGFIGFMDDVLGWLKGIRQKTKVLLTVSIAFPLVIVNAGHSIINIPILGLVDFGILYPLLIIPIGIIGAANGYNMLAGYNGLEAGLGVIIVGTLTCISFLNGYLWLTMIGMIAVSSLIAFLLFNWYPAKIFPGDSLTYMIGALIAAMAIMGNMQTIAVVLFIPFICDLILTSRSKFKAVAFAKVNKDNSLTLPYKKIYDLTHLVIFLLSKVKKKVYEQDVVITIIGFEFLLTIISVIFLV
ncbi:MAG: glycosyl transferase family 4 [Candidatus Aenigmarchaeota archaeon]|nr:glycosyl transferase family 4 [Candidatus Aenigmarchaeota archaeon]